MYKVAPYFIIMPVDRIRLFHVDRPMHMASTSIRKLGQGVARVLLSMQLQVWCRSLRCVTSLMGGTDSSPERAQQKLYLQLHIIEARQRRDQNIFCD